MLQSRLLPSALLLFSAGFAVAQFRAGVQGTVTDPTGAVIPNANITLTNNETRREQTTTSGPEGFYRFSGLAPGSYNLRAEAPGFKVFTLAQVRIQAEQIEGVDLHLEPGVVTESVTVTADSSPVLQTEQANVGRTLTKAEVDELPQLNRNPYELLRLTPGVFGTAGRSGSGGSINLPNTTGPGGSNLSIFQSEQQVPISANGQRVSDNNYMVDGVSVNSLAWGGAAVVTPNQESVKQITVNSNTYSAEYGRNSGAQIQVVSQNGTNNFHGSGVFKYATPGLNAYNKWGGPNNAPALRVENAFRQWAGSIGGPILRDRLFFFFSYEGMRNNSNAPYTAWIETAQYRQAVIGARPNSVTARILNDPNMQPRVAAPLTSPCPSGFAPGTCQEVAGGLDIGSLTGGTGQYVDVGAHPTGGGLDGVPDIQWALLGNPVQQRGNQYNGRFDYSRGADSLAFSTYITRFNSLTADTAGRSRPVADVRNTPQNSSYTLTYNRTITPTTLNEARFNFTRFASNQVTSSATTNWGLPRVEIESLPFDRIRFGPPWAETTPAIFAQNTYELRDYVRKIWGKHATSFGVEIRWEQDNTNFLGGDRPLYSAQGLWNFANDAPVYYQINANPQTGGPPNSQFYFRDRMHGFFAQDDWKVRQNLTINLGLRYEYYTPLSEKRSRISNIVIPGPADIRNARVEPTDQLFQPDRNNFAPRIGFAYNPSWWASRAVVRGGYGLYYNRIPNALFENLRGNPPFFARYSICCGTASDPYFGGKIQYATGSSNSPESFPVNPALAVGIDPATGGPLNTSVELWGAFQNMPNPYAMIYSFSVEYNVATNMVASAGYQGSSARKNIRIVNQNFLYPNNPAFFAIYMPQPDVNLEYNALLLSLTKQASHGIQFAANYRWSRSIDQLSYEGPGAVTNQTWPQDQRTERGPSDYDVTHYFNVSAVWELPIFRKPRNLLEMLVGGWQISPIYTWHSGFPWTPKTGQSVSTPGGPTLAPTRPVAYFGGALNQSDNSAFMTRANSNFPNGGRAYFDISHGGPPGVGRNVFRGPRFSSFDMAFAKEFQFGHVPALGEATRLELRVNVYNAFNELNLAPLNFFDAGTYVEDPNFGLSSAGLAGRTVELQARFSF